MRSCTEDRVILDSKISPRKTPKYQFVIVGVDDIAGHYASVVPKTVNDFIFFAFFYVIRGLIALF